MRECLKNFLKESLEGLVKETLKSLSKSISKIISEWLRRENWVPGRIYYRILGKFVWGIAREIIEEIHDIFSKRISGGISNEITGKLLDLLRKSMEGFVK